MSKKTRNKSSKPAPRKAARTPQAKPAKKQQTRSRPTTASKPAKAGTEKNAKPTPAASHKAPSKRLKKPNPPKAAKPPVAASGLAEGAKAPAFRLLRDGGSTVSLSDFAGGKLVLFFYPRADTPGCTREAIDFTRLAGAFADSGTAVLGVSADPPKAQEAFRDKHELVTPLASDETHQMLEAYGVWGEKSMYGKTFQGILRTTVLIGSDARIIHIWRNVRVDGHADEVLAAARAV